MNITKTSSNHLWNICIPIADKVTSEAQERNLDINTTIHPFKTLVPPNLINVEDWNDTSDYIAVAVYNLSLHHIAKNIPALLQQHYLVR